MTRTRSLFLLFLIAGVGACTEAAPDLIIRNARVLDGTGGPPEVKDIAVAEGRILALGVKLPFRGIREIDAAGLTVCPGFIDVHNHADGPILERPDCHNLILQGITTVVAGNCGHSPVDMAAFFEALNTKEVACNLACLIGHNSVREEVMGMRAAQASEEELKAMETLVRRAMEDGALGMSTGLLYPPGTFATYQEVLALAKVVGEYDGIYASHIRNEEQTVWEALEEALRIGEDAGIRVQISHVKLAAEVHWGKVDRYLEMLSNARARNVRAMGDQYPYAAGSATLENILPRWTLDGGREAFLERVKDPENRARIRQEILKGRLASARGGNRGEIVFISRCRAHPEYEGKNLVQLCSELGLETTSENAAEMAIRLLEDGPVSAVNFLMDEADVRTFLQDPNLMISTDGGVPGFGEGVPHPRNYGTYPRLLGHFVREEGLLTLEEAIRKSTSLPADFMDLVGRGSLGPGKWADIVVFNPETILDNADFQNPHQYPSGIEYVIVNGVIAAEHGSLTGARPGQVVRRRGWIQRGAN